MTEENLSWKERRRLTKIDNALNWRFPVSVKEHFNKAGKLQTFVQAPTEEEKRQQMEYAKDLLGKNAGLASLKSMDVFLKVARRVGSDAELAALLPENTFTARDAELLEKLRMDSLAALIRLRQ